MLFGLCLGIGTTIGVMIWGWGLEPRSWFWIIGVYLIGHILAQMIVEVGKAKDE